MALVRDVQDLLGGNGSRPAVGPGAYSPAGLDLVAREIADVLTRGGTEAEIRAVLDRAEEQSGPESLTNALASERRKLALLLWRGAASNLLSFSTRYYDLLNKVLGELETRNLTDMKTEALIRFATHIVRWAERSERFALDNFGGDSKKQGLSEQDTASGPEKLFKALLQAHAVSAEAGVNPAMRLPSPPT